MVAPSFPSTGLILISVLLASPATAQTCPSGWSALGSGLTGGSGDVGAYSLAVFDDGSGPVLHAGGNFAIAGGLPVDNVCKWDGTRWRPLGFGLGFTVTALTVFDGGNGPSLYAPGFRWTGAAWVELPPFPATGGNSSPPCMIVHNDGSGPALYVGGGFSGNGYNGIARWNGTAWSTVGNGVTSPQGAAVQSMAVFDDDGPGPHAPALHVGGAFQFAGGVPASGIARWDGVSWSGVGGGLTNNLFLPEVHAMAVFDDGQGGGPALYISGYFVSAGGVAASAIARWNGSAWSAFGGPFGSDGRAMLVFDDGGGPGLYVAGLGEGVLSHGIARWNGIAWSIPAGGMSGGGISGTRGYALATFDAGSGPGLYVGGHFDQAGTIPASNIARYGLPLCPANCDGSRDASGCPTLSVADFGCFLNRFAAGDQRANCDASTRAPTLNIADFQCFLNRFAEGCG